MGPILRLALLVVALVATAVYGLWAPASEGAARGEPLVIVSPHWEGIREEMGRAFTAYAARSGRQVRLDWLNPGGTSSCLRFVRSRFAESPGGIGVDLFYGGGVEPHLVLAEAGLLVPGAADSAILAAIPPELGGAPLYDDRAGWYGTSLVTFGIVYNRPLLRRLGLPEPTSFVDLGRAEPHGWVGLADLRRSGTVHMIYELILQGRGWEEGYRLLARIAGGSRRIYSFASEVPLETGSGEIALGLTLDSYAWAQTTTLGTEAIGFIAPEGESLVNTDAVAVLKGAPHAALAREFVNWSLSPEGQALWMLPRGSRDGPERYTLARLPVRPDVFAARRRESALTLDPFADRRRIRYDPELGSRRWTLLNAALGATLIDSQRELARAWREVIAAGRPAAAEELLTRPPFPEEAIGELSAMVRDPLPRNELMARWAREALDRYHEARRLARSGPRGAR